MKAKSHRRMPSSPAVDRHDAGIPGSTGITSFAYCLRCSQVQGSTMTKGLVLRRLYRSLLQSSKPFTSPSKDAVVLSCLLHRTGMDDAVEDWSTLVARYVSGEESSSPSGALSTSEKPMPEALARDLSRSYAELKEEFNLQESWKDSMASDDESRAPHRVLFRRLLREVVAGNTSGFAQMLHPSRIDTTRLRDVIRREFRSEEGAVSAKFDISVRQQVAFNALRALNQKLEWAESLGTDTDESARRVRNHRQQAKNVSPLPLKPPSSYLKPGSYLVAHPLLTGFFTRTVICLLEHTESAKGGGGTYGLIVNRVGVSPTTGRDCTLRDVIRSDSLPQQLAKAFGDCSIREGGPVHMSLQMMHTCAPGQEEPLGVGGTVLSSVNDPDQVSSVVPEADRSVYFQGNISRAADAVVSGEMDRDDVSFYIGASCWEPGQLESEIDRGFWFPCRGPPDIALTGMCGHKSPSKEEADGKVDRPKADLWLSMMCALGENEANLAHLLWDAQLEEESGGACDVI